MGETQSKEPTTTTSNPSSASENKAETIRKARRVHILLQSGKKSSFKSSKPIDELESASPPVNSVPVPRPRTSTKDYPPKPRGRGGSDLSLAELKKVVYSVAESEKEFPVDDDDESFLFEEDHRDDAVSTNTPEPNEQSAKGKEVASIGYSQSSSEIAGPAYTDGEDNDYDNMMEALQLLNKLSPSEKMDCAMKLADEYPFLPRRLRDGLEHYISNREIEIMQEQPAGPFFDESLNSNLNWNSQFQALIEELSTCEEAHDRMRVYSLLASLAQDFIYCAKTYGKLIISEVYLPNDQKTIKPYEQLGGFAGGQKYIVKGILFKFAVDQHNIYGSDEIAAKVAGHDLKGLIQYFNLGISGLHFPLMALVDYMGFRLQALSLLPLNANTIIYGTPDGGRNIYAEVADFLSKMKLSCKKLNLLPHMVGLTKKKSKLLYSCADVEGHEGLDGRYYLVDFSRAFPPVDISKTVDVWTVVLFTQFLGFVANHGAANYIKQVKEATAVLYGKLIPACAGELNQVTNEQDLQKYSLKDYLHKKGINLAYMGLIRQHLSDTNIAKRLLLIEMIARVAKHQINRKLRDKMKELKVPVQEPYKLVVIEYLNLLFGTSSKSEEYWGDTLKQQILTNFPQGLTKEEMQPQFRLRKIFEGHEHLICVMFKTIQKLTGLTLIDLTYKDFSENPKSFNFEKPFDDTDILELGERLKHLNVVEASMGYYLKDKALVKTGANSKRLLDLAVEKFKEALHSNPEDKNVLRQLASVYDFLGDRVLARKYFREAIDADPSDENTLFKYAVFLEEIGDYSLAEEHFLKSLECNPNEEKCLYRYAAFLKNLGNLEESEKFFELARRHSSISNTKSEEVYENERRGGSSWSKSELSHTDYRGPWSTKTGIPRTKEQIDAKLPTNWEWTTEWTIDNERGDNDGWEYAYHWTYRWHSSPTDTDYVRRRRWKRTRTHKAAILAEIPNVPVSQIVQQMLDPQNGIEIQDRQWHQKTYKNCFVGKEFVQWLVDHYRISRDSAVQFGNKLLAQKIIHHVTYEHLFSDDTMYYQFADFGEVTKKKSATFKGKEFDQVQKEGYLEKQGFIIQNWKKRWCVLKKGSLYYYRRPEDENPRGIISLVQAKVRGNVASPVGESMPLCFVIKTGTRDYIIRTADTKEKEAWMAAISANSITS